MDNFFDQEAEAVARVLIGKTFVCGGKRGTISKVQPFSREENAHRYKPVLAMRPGEVYCGWANGYVMLLLVTAGGGCILLQCAQLDGVLRDGPGKLSRALGLTKSGAAGATRWLDATTFEINI